MQVHIYITIVFAFSISGSINPQNYFLEGFEVDTHIYIYHTYIEWILILEETMLQVAHGSITNLII